MTTLSVTSSCSRSRIDAAVRQRLGDLLDEIRLQNCFAREVDVHVAAIVACHSASCRSDSRSTHWPIGRISPVSSAIGTISSAATSSSPRCQRTSASNPITFADSQRHDRLVVDAQLAALDRAPQLGLELQQLHGALVHGLVEDLVNRAGRATWRGTWRCRRRAARPAAARSRSR